MNKTLTKKHKRSFKLVALVPISQGEDTWSSMLKDAEYFETVEEASLKVTNKHYGIINLSIESVQYSLPTFKSLRTHGKTRRT